MTAVSTGTGNPMAERIAALAAGADRLASESAHRRAALAEACMHTTAAAADRWVELAGDIKAADASPARTAVLAEETGTGPLVTLRLLMITRDVWRRLATGHLPKLPGGPRVAHRPPPGLQGLEQVERIEVDLVPWPGLYDGIIFTGTTATVRCVNTGGPAHEAVAGFMRLWQEEATQRPQGGGVAVVLGAGNVTGLSAADAISQIFDHGRAVLLKLHPLHERLIDVFREALGPLVEAGLLEVVAGGPEVLAEAVGCSRVTQLHLTGGRATYDRIRDDLAARGLDVPISCELGNVTPWFVIPGKYSDFEIGRQADAIAGSIINNTSFNCIATKLVVTCGSWEGREKLLRAIRSRLDASPRRAAWFPGSGAGFEQLTGERLPDDGCLPWTFRAGVDPVADRMWLDREWFFPAVAEIPLEADSIEQFCGKALELARSLPGNLAANVSLPKMPDHRDRQRAELLVEHLGFGVVSVNTWAALGYALAGLPWGGLPGGTAADPGSGIGSVHDPLMLPLVHNTIVRGPLAPSLKPAWLPWHSGGRGLTRSLIDVYTAGSFGRAGWGLIKMLPAVVRG
jgi:hypothetical protein